MLALHGVPGTSIRRTEVHPACFVGDERRNSAGDLLVGEWPECDVQLAPVSTPALRMSFAFPGRQFDTTVAPFAFASSMRSYNLRYGAEVFGGAPPIMAPILTEPDIVPKPPHCDYVPWSYAVTAAAELPVAVATAVIPMVMVEAIPITAAEVGLPIEGAHALDVQQSYAVTAAAELPVAVATAVIPLVIVDAIPNTAAEACLPIVAAYALDVQQQCVPCFPLPFADPMELQPAKAWRKALLHAVESRVNRNSQREPIVDEMKDIIYETSCSPISANSRRLRTLPKSSPAHAVAVLDTAADIGKYGAVGAEDIAACVAGYANGRVVHGKCFVPGVAIHDMHVCGFCGVRDPELNYFRTGEACDPPPSSSPEYLVHHASLFPSPPLQALSELQDSHFLVVNPVALMRLRERPDLVLLGADESEILVPEVSLHNLADIGGRTLHLIKEAVLEGDCVDLCQRCALGYRKECDAASDAVEVGPIAEGVAPGAEAVAEGDPSLSAVEGASTPCVHSMPLSPGSRVSDGAAERCVTPSAAPVNGSPSSPDPGSPLSVATPETVISGDASHVALDSDGSSVFDTKDFYDKRAPVESVAGGNDYGSLSALRGAGVLVDASDVEQIVLAETRCYQYTVKVSGAADARWTFRGHSVIFPHEYVHVGAAEFTEDVLKAALLELRVLLVGPKDVQTRLERECLKLASMQLRPALLYNWLLIRHQVQGGPKPPSLLELRDMLHRTNVGTHVAANGRQVIDPLAVSVEKASRASDLAEVRADSDGSVLGDTHVDSVSDGPDRVRGGCESGPAALEPVGLMPGLQQGMDAVLRGIEQAVVRPQRDESGDLIMRRCGDPVNDYTDAAKSLVETWWPLFPLGRPPAHRGKTLDRGKPTWAVRCFEFVNFWGEACRKQI